MVDDVPNSTALGTPSARKQPWEPAWEPAGRARAYERVVVSAWPLITRPLVPRGPDGRAYFAAEVYGRLHPVAEHLAHGAVPLDEQRAFLLAYVEPLEEQWLEAAYGTCGRSRAAEGADDLDPNCPTGVRPAFAHRWGETLRRALWQQNAYGRGLERPRLIRWYPLSRWCARR